MKAHMTSDSNTVVREVYFIAEIITRAYLFFEVLILHFSCRVFLQYLYQFGLRSF